MLYGEIRQTYQGVSARYSIFLENQQIASAVIPYNVSMGTIRYMVNENCRYHLEFDMTNQAANWAKEIERRQYTRYRILDGGGSEAGSVCQKRRKGFLRGYSYHEISLGDVQYHIYCVPMGKKGKKYPLYLLKDRQEIQVALMEKPCVVEDMKDRYLFRTWEERYAEPLALYALYGDLVYHGNRGELPLRSREVQYEVTFNKDLKEKYREDF